MNNQLDKVLPVQIARAWNSILSELSALDMEVLEFTPTKKANNHWALLIEEKNKSSAEQSFYHKMLNADVKNGFKDSKREKLKYWETIFSEFTFSGFCIPINDVHNVKTAQLGAHLYFYQLLFKKFPYQNFFSTLSIFKSTIPLSEHLVPHTIWFYAYYYAQFLHQLKRDANEGYARYGMWFSELLDLENFHTRLPSVQATILLFNLCETLVANTDQQWQNKRIFSIGAPAVNDFFQTYESQLSLFFGNPNQNVNPELLINDQEKVRQAFVGLFSNDYENLLLQDILDNQSDYDLYQSLSRVLQLQYGPKSVYSVSGVLKDKVFNADKRPAGIFDEDANDMPKFKKAKKNLYLKNGQYWFDLLPAKRAELIEIVEAASTEVLLEKSKGAIEKRVQENWVDLINLIAAPILVWNNNDVEKLPQWNLFDDLEKTSLKDLKEQREKEKAKENEALENLIKAILKLETIVDLNNYLEINKPSFSFHTFHRRWKNELNRNIIRIKQKEKYDEARMKEFGIWESDLSSIQKRAWLKEILAVEEEIKPYITFVKKAFQAALPIRRRISFNDLRHTSDGVVFDPETLFDHEKWMRANVMKVMQTKTEIGDAIQVNTFCLDYSGSMNHDRMRNLFKMLYLLVLGLEDRKSIDAFHFFSNRFIVGADFSKEFTNRKVLFKIMRQITITSLLGQLIFRGEGGTNISTGIDLSHSKMNNFIEEFLATNPYANVVSSIFVITDGEPSVGITEPKELNAFINEKRADGDVAIKGIFIKSEDEVSLDLMEEIFGTEHFIETDDFEEGVNRFVKIMTETYKQQRKNYKWKQKKRKLGLTK